MPKPSAAAAALMDDGERYSAALYCAICPLQEKCGGLHCKASPIGCGEFCCGQQVGCTTVCPRNPDYLEQLSEVGGFDLQSVPHCAGHLVYLPQKIVPLIYHGSKRKAAFRGDFVALRFADLIDFGRRSSKFTSRLQLCETFKIGDECGIIITGVDHDPAIEKVWRLGSARLRVFRELAELGVACATTPNFSMILDVPRADNLHAMQRIAILYHEMSEAGLPAALHVNGRTEHDFVRWGEFLRSRPYITAISYEFITGSGLTGRIRKHTEWLNRLQETAGRRLTCIVRGNPAALDLLHNGYSLVYIETTSFVKSIKRQISIRFGNSGLRWSTLRSEGHDVSGVLQTNFYEVKNALTYRYPRLGNGM